MSATLRALPLGPAKTACREDRIVPRSSWSLLRDHDFCIYFIGSLISNLGTWLQTTAQILLTYQVTHSVLIIGLITSAQFLGMVVVSPWAPVLVDRIGPKTMLIGTQFGSALIAAGMAWRYSNDALGIHTLFLGALSLSLAYGLALPVQTALLPTLVGPEDTAGAMKMNSVSYNAGRALAPILSVPMIFLVGAGLIFALNAFSFLIFAIVLGRLAAATDQKPLLASFAVVVSRFKKLICDTLVTIFNAFPSRFRQIVGSPPVWVIFVPVQPQLKLASGYAPPKIKSRRPQARMTDGIRFALRHRRILLLLAIVAAVTLADDPILVLSPALAHTKLHVSSVWTGCFIAALGWGSVLGSLPPSSARDRGARHASRIAAYWLLILAASVLLFTLGISSQLSLFAAFAAGVAGLFTGSAAQAALLRHQRNMGAGIANTASVATLWAIAWAGTKPFASLLDGWLASHIGILPTTVALIVPATLIALLEVLLPKRSRRYINAQAEYVIVRIGRLGWTDSHPPPPVLPQWRRADAGAQRTCLVLRALAMTDSDHSGHRCTASTLRCSGSYRTQTRAAPCPGNGAARMPSSRIGRVPAIPADPACD
jgi:predicted MFS family arabinose efflux permease